MFARRSACPDGYYSFFCIVDGVHCVLQYSCGGSWGRAGTAASCLSIISLVVQTCFLRIYTEVLLDVQVDGIENPKVQSVFFPDTPLHKAAFANDGAQVTGGVSARFSMSFADDMIMSLVAGIVVEFAQFHKRACFCVLGA